MEIENNNSLDEVLHYIYTVCSKINNKRVHQEVEDELLTHILDLYNEYSAESSNKNIPNICNLSKDKLDYAIVKKVLNHMGDCETLGNKLNKVHTSKVDWGIIISSCLMASFGLIFLYIFHKLGAFDKIYGIGTMYIFQRSVIFATVGILALFFASFVDFRIFKRYSILIYIVSILLLFSSKLFQDVNGIQHWIRMGSITINVIQLCPALFIISTAGIFTNINWTDRRDLLKGIVLSIIPFILFVLFKSLFASVIYSISLITLLIIMRFDKIYTLSIAILQLVIIFINKNFFINMTYFYNEGFESNYLSLQLNSMLRNSKIIGQASNFNANIIPEFYTDYLFAYIVYNFGWLIGFLVIVLITFLLIKIFKVVFIAKSLLAKLLILGLGTMLSLQFIWHILINLGLLPIDHVPLPIIGYSGSTIVISLFLIGIVINVYKGKTLTKVNLDI